LNIISLFCGAGGLDLGFEQEGFNPVVAYDIYSSAIATYNANRPHNSVARIADLSTKTGNEIIQDISSLGINEPPIGVVGGPPCQYFSNGNKSVRNQEDIRRFLPMKYAEILKHLNQEYELDFFILENVDGLGKPKHASDFIKIKELFEEAGFYVSSRILDAYNYGVPQFRKRLFIIGLNNTKYERNKYQFPPGNPSGLTIIDRIGGLEEPAFYAKRANPRLFPVHPNHWTMNPRSSKFSKQAPIGLKPSTRSFRRLEWDRPSYTIAYGHNEIHIHPNGNRRLSIYEAMLLQGFPPEYVLLGNLCDQVKLVSDAVPPPMAAALARSIKESI
jgi:DNA (cytosine-5)-methyltransferase 1